jgi:hypothetical protein
MISINKSLHLVVAKRLATLLDDKYQILGINFGLDPLLDLIPGIGDVIATLIGFYLIYVAKLYDLPQEKINKMAVNLVLDFLIGLVPVAGNIGTIFFRSNRMNMKIIEDHLKSNGGVIEEGEVVG